MGLKGGNGGILVVSRVLTLGLYASGYIIISYYYYHFFLNKMLKNVKTESWFSIWYRISPITYFSQLVLILGSNRRLVLRDRSKKRHSIISNRDIGSYQDAITCRNRYGWIEIEHIHMFYYFCKYPKFINYMHNLSIFFVFIVHWEFCQIDWLLLYRVSDSLQVDLNCTFIKYRWVL